MGGNNDMGFTYDGNPGHYQLWKPPGNYFPRGEAPPPYEEAIALAQAESMNTCTVSVATTHRTLPLTVCNSEPDINAGMPQNTTTTNLINININNAGNITAVAAGENHILSGNNFGRSPSNTLSRTTESGLISMQPITDSGIYPCSQQIISLPREIPCTLQNCELNTGTMQNQICNMPTTNRSPACQVRNNILMPKEVQTSNQSIATVSNNQHLIERYNNNNSNVIEVVTNKSMQNVPTTILPPPLFNNDPMTVATAAVITTTTAEIGQVLAVPDISTTETPKTPSTKRYHRTIPRHLTTEPVMSNLKPQPISSSGDAQSPNSNKKPACQCPVQHVPMTYMGSTQISATQQSANNLFLSTLTTKLNNVAAKQSSVVAKSTSFPSTSEIQTISKQEPAMYQGASGYDPTHSLRRMKPTLLKLEAAHPNALGITNNTPRRKIETVSKQVNKEFSNKIETVLLQQQQQIQQQQQQFQEPPPKPILKSNSRNSLLEARSNENLLAASNCIETVCKTVPEPNPVLPPKLYKTSSQKQPNYYKDSNGSYYSNSKIHTITRPSETAQFSILNNRNSAEMSSLRMRHNASFHKSLPRTESAYSDVDKLATLTKTHVIPSNYSGNNTLPKNTTSKHSNRSSISDVVNKVPSVITLPHPQSATSTLVKSSKSRGGHDTHSNRHTPSTTPTSSYLYGMMITKHSDKPLPVLTTSTNCMNPKQHFLPNDTSLDDDYLSECENCKTAHGSRYYLDEEVEGETMETMTLQRKMPDNENDEQQNYYRVSSTLPSNTNKKQP